MNQTPTKSHGVTLLELLVAMVILTIIVASVYTAFNSSKQSWQVGDTNAQKYQNARGVLDVMSREIACAVVNDWGASTGQRMDFYGRNSSTGWRSNSVEDELYFIARIDPASSSTADADLCEVGYYVTDENSDGIGDVLRRFYITDDAGTFDYDFQTPGGNPGNSELGLNIIALNFRYLNHYNVWETDDEWDSCIGGNEEGILPKAVEITITVWDDKQVSKTREFKTVVYIPGSEQ